MHTRRVILLPFALVLVWTWTAAAQAAKPASAAAPRPAPAAAKSARIQATPEAAPVAIARYDSQRRRDPFLSPVLTRKKEAPPDEEVDGGQPPPGVAGMSVTKVALLGISTREGGRTAVFRGTDSRAYFLQEGDKFHDGYLRSIADDSVVLVRQRHYRSGKVVTDEITRRLRTP